MVARNHYPRVLGSGRSVVLLGIALTLAGCGDATGPAPCAGGETTECWTFLGLEGEYIEDLIETPWGVFAATRRSGVQRLTAGGGWEPLGLEHGRVTSLVFLGGEQPRLLAGMCPTDPPIPPPPLPAAVYATEDGGRTWEESDAGVFESEEEADERCVTSLTADVNVPGRVWWGHEMFTVMRSEDYGRTWRIVAGKADNFGGIILSILSSPTGRTWFGGSDAFNQSKVILTENGGESWTGSSPAGGYETNVFDFLEHPDRPDRVWVAMGDFIHRSDEGGTSGSWKQVVWAFDLSGRPTVFMDLALVDDRRYVVTWEYDPWNEPDSDKYLGLYWAPLSSEDWRAIPVPEEAGPGMELLPLSDGTFLIGTYGGVWRFTP